MALRPSVGGAQPSGSGLQNKPCDSDSKHKGRPARGAGSPASHQTAGGRRSPGGAAPGRPQRRPRVPRGPACCTRSRPPPPWPRPRDIERSGGQAWRRAGISTAGPRAPSAPAGGGTGAATAPGLDGHSCREAGAETGRAAARSRGQRGLGPAAPHGPGRRRPRGSSQVAWALPGRGHRHRHWAYPELPARPTAVQGRGRAIPAGAAASACCARGAAVERPPPWNPHSRGGGFCLLRGSAQRTRARRPLRADYRPSATSARLVGRCAPVLLPPPRKGVRTPGRGARHRGESAVTGPIWRAGVGVGEATAA